MRGIGDDVDDTSASPILRLRGAGRQTSHRGALLFMPTSLGSLVDPMQPVLRFVYAFFISELTSMIGRREWLSLMTRSVTKGMHRFLVHPVTPSDTAF